MILSEQEVINAVCAFAADQDRSEPEEAEAELLFDDETGFSAEVYVRGRKQEYDTGRLIAAIRFWLDVYLKQDPNAGIELILDDEEGIQAVIR